MKRDGQVRDVIGNTIKEKKLLSGAIVCTVLGAVLVSLVPPLILAQIVDRLTAGKDVTAVLMLLYFRHAGSDRAAGIGKRRSADCIWPEDYTRAAQQTDEEVRQTDDG